MTSNPLIPGKSLPASTPTASYSPAPPQPIASSSFESNRRQSPSQQGTARKSQASRKQHRNQRRAGTGSGNGGGNGGMGDEDDMMAEIRAIRNASSRRGQTSITHLLNYSVPRPQHYHDHTSHSRSFRRTATHCNSAADKARYVHANYRFVVSPAGSYTSQAADADEHLDWNDVLQVIASAESQQASCPICLSDPVAPRMAKCGHIFCLPCVIRFMNTSGAGDAEGGGGKTQNRWRRCPICDDSVYISDMRPLRFYAAQESPLPRVGGDVILRLMMRTAGSTLALPSEGGADVLSSQHGVPWHFAATVLDYARIMKGTGDYMEGQYDEEIEALLRQEKEDELLFHEDNEWTQRAIKTIRAAKEKVKDLGAEQAAYDSAAAGSSRVRPVQQDFHFYTSPPHLYLSPLDIRILKSQYGDFSSFPSTLLPKVEHITTGHVLDYELRKRAKYLGHLPYGCLIGFLECDWTEIVSAEILETFKEELERRRKRNRDKSAQEDRERLQAERLEQAALRGTRRNLIGAATLDDEVTLRFSAETEEHPVFDLNEFQPLGAQGQAATPPNPRPGFAHLQDLSTSPSGPRTVWGTVAVPGSPGTAPTRRAPVDDGWLKDDEVLETLGAADLAEQMEALGFKDGPSSSSSAVPSGGGGKKKKKQKITLMSTGGRRGL